MKICIGITEWEACKHLLAKSQINNINKIITSKITQGKTYNSLFEDYSDLFQKPLVSTNSSPNHYWVYGLVFNKNDYRDELIKVC